MRNKTKKIYGKRSIKRVGDNIKCSKSNGLSKQLAQKNPLFLFFKKIYISISCIVSEVDSDHRPPQYTPNVSTSDTLNLLLY